MIANIANMIKPVLPNGSKAIKEMLNLPEYKWEEENINGDYEINNLKVLYDRIDENDLEL